MSPVLLCSELKLAEMTVVSGTAEPSELPARSKVRRAW